MASKTLKPYTLTESRWLNTVHAGLKQITGWVWVQILIWLNNLVQDHKCTCFDINFSDRQEGSMMSSIMWDRWWHLKIVAFECHRGWASVKIKDIIIFIIKLLRRRCQTQQRILHKYTMKHKTQWQIVWLWLWIYLIKMNTKWSSIVWDLFVIKDADKSN